jgi:copper homeostasis protein
LGVTFHRAIDQCANYEQAIENVASLGCERILTSGLAPNVEQGVETLAHMVQLADGRISIMAGAGLTDENVAYVVNKTGVREVHLSGKTTRSSQMNLVANQAKMGTNQLDDFIVPVTNPEAIKKVVDAICER